MTLLCSFLSLSVTLSLIFLVFVQTQCRYVRGRKMGAETENIEIWRGKDEEKEKVGWQSNR